MPDGNPEDGEPHAVDLSPRISPSLLTDEALRYASHVNLYKGRPDRPAHQVSAAARWLILNDMRDGAW